MNETPDNYVPVSLLKRFRRQAVRVWAAGLVLVFAWVLLIVAAPFAKAGGLTGVSTPLYSFYGFICHQMAERSFHVHREQLAVCSRCFGVYFGLLFGFAIYPLWRSIVETEPPARFWLFLSLIPIAIDWSLTMFGIWENTQLSRFTTGLILGIACATYIVPAIIEITRNMSHRRLVKGI